MADLASLPNMTTIDTTKKDGEKVEMTDKEKRRFQECLQDPKFVQLWKDYADDISDPKHLAEQEEYLKQVEREANEKGDYSFTFAFPQPNFCVRLKQTGKDIVYINICDSDKVDEPKEETTADRMASNWQVPVSIGKIRGEEVEGKAAIVFDAAYHPKATYLAHQSDRFMVFLVEIAVENINANEAHRKELSANLSMDFTRVKEPRAIGNPKPQTLRIAAVQGKEGELVFPKPKGKAEPAAKAFDGAKPGDEFSDRLAAGMGDTVAKKRIAQRKKDAAEAQAKKEREEAEKRRREEAEAREKERERRSKEKKGAKAFAKGLQSAFGGPAPPEPEPAQPPGTQQPEYTIVHQGEVDIGDAWGDKDMHAPVRPPPKNLILRVQLPGVRKASELDLGVEERSVSLKAPAQQLALSVPLPHPIDADKAKAKFEKAKGQLTLTLPVVHRRSADDRQHAEQRRRERDEFAAEARRQKDAEDEEVRKEREAVEAVARVEREEERRKEAERAAQRREVEEAMEKAAAEERARRAAQREEEEAAERRREEEERGRRAAQLQRQLGEQEGVRFALEEKEGVARATTGKEEARGMRTILRDLEAAKVAERMAERQRQRDAEVPLTNRYIWELS